MSGGAGDNKTLPEQARDLANVLRDRGVLFGAPGFLDAMAVALEAAEADRARLRRERVEDAHDWTAVREAAASTGPTAIEEVLAVYMGTRAAFDLGFSCDLVDEVRGLEARVEAVEAQNAETTRRMHAYKELAEYNDSRAVVTAARVVALEAENAELKAGGDRPEAVAVAQEVWIASPGADVDVIGHDGMECNPDCVACFFAAEASRYRKALREVENIAAQHAGVTPEAYEDISDVTRAAAVRPQTDTPDHTLATRLLKEAYEMPNLSEYEDGGANLRYWLREASAALKASVLDALSRDDLQGLYDHLGTIPFVRGSWSNNWRAALSAVLASSVKQEKEGLGGHGSAVSRAQEDQP